MEKLKMTTAYQMPKRNEENAGICERMDDSFQRIREFSKEQSVPAPYRDYFLACASFADSLDKFLAAFQEEDLATTERIPELKNFHKALFQPYLVSYEMSWLNPVYAVEKLGDCGSMLSAFYLEVLHLIPQAFEKNYAAITAVLETLIQLYCSLEDDAENPKKPQELRDILYSYGLDYSENFSKEAMDGLYMPENSYPVHAVKHNEFLKSDDLYRMGYYVSEEVLKTFSFIASLSEEKIDCMARTWYQGFKDGFRLQGKPYEKKSVINFVYEAGFERVVRRTAELFYEDGFDFAIPRASLHFVTRNPGQARGLYVSPNRQMDYDHSYDAALVMGDRIAARLLEERRAVFVSYGDRIRRYAGPVVMECFGEAEFTPVDHKEALRFTEHQTEVYGRYRNNLQLLVHEFVLEEERSFTIISWPLPGIGKDFEEIFRDTIAINTLKSEEYMPVQQALIDALDQAGEVHVTGRGNDTDITVQLHPLANPEKESNFENCLSDVNIPLGEVFTSPKLEGTRGTLHVRKVFIDGIQFRDLRLQFQDGRVVDYSCDNFEDTDASRALVKKIIFGEKDHLPLGEFAIGTNTKAYRMTEQYQIGARMPILIAEKTGPHFAVGDTCYSFMEDMHLFNPDGKELVAKDNSVSACRKTDPSKAYFAVHTDITIPYNELGDIVAVCADGRRISIIHDGRFVLPGTEVLNEALDEQ